jgi:hypothetical protein
MENKENIDKWLKFLEPENLKDNLIFSSLYIANFESFKDYVIDQIKFFFHCGFSQGKDSFDPEYIENVKSKDKKYIDNASLLWLVEMEAICLEDFELYKELRQYRNKLSHQLMVLLFDGLSDELPAKFVQLIQLRVKIEKWWILNIDIPTNSDFDNSPEIQESDIVTASEITNQIIFDMLSGDDKKATFYRDEFVKNYKQ